MHGKCKGTSRRVGYALLRTGVDDDGRVLLVDQGRNESLLDVEDTWLAYQYKDLVGLLGSRTHPKRLTLKTSCQASIPDQDVPVAPMPALFIKTATWEGDNTPES